MTNHKSITGDPGRVIGYIRCSTEDQTLSPQVQKDAIIRWCAANGAKLVDVIEDIGVSGGAPLDKRPGMLVAIAALSSSHAGVLVVAKRDRLARDPMVAAMIEAGARRNGARVVSAVGEGTEGDDPTAVLMRRIVDAFAEYERLIIKARTRSALALKKQRGELTGQCPFGFKVADDGVQLVTCPVEQRSIGVAHALRREGLSYRDIVTRMNELGIPARGSRWHLSSIQRLLQIESSASIAA